MPNPARVLRSGPSRRNLRRFGLALAALATVVLLTPHLPASGKRSDPAGSYRARGNWLFNSPSNSITIGRTNFEGTATLSGKKMKYNATAEDNDGEDVATNGRIKFKRKPTSNKKNTQTPGDANVTLKFDGSGNRDKFDLDSLNERYQIQRNRKKKWIISGDAAGFLKKRRFEDGTTEVRGDTLAISFKFVSN